MKKSPPAKSASPLAAPRRSAGRPAGLSREAIIETTMDMLASGSTDELNFAKLAERLGVSSMTLYNYFPNREALLNAVADHAFSLFQLPRGWARKPWQEQLLAWLWALQRHCRQHPVVLKVMGFDGGLSRAWVAATTPAYRVLRERGLAGRDLAQVSSWFMSDAMGLIIADALMPIYRRPPTLAHIEAVDADQQDIHLTLRKHLAEIDSDAWLDFGFRRLIASLEQYLTETGTTPSA